MDSSSYDKKKKKKLFDIKKFVFLIILGSSPVVANMIVTGDLYGWACKISRGAHKLTRTPMLIIKNKFMDV